jgi:hypothetical protein
MVSFSQLPHRIRCSKSWDGQPPFCANECTCVAWVPVTLHSPLLRCDYITSLWLYHTPALAVNHGDVNSFYATECARPEYCHLALFISTGTTLHANATTSLIQTLL